MERHPSLDERFDPAVRMVDHDPQWAVRAKAEIDRLRRELGQWAERVEHVGSTAVPGLAAKPIIDLQLSVPAIADSGRYVASLERLGYLFAPDPHSPDYRFFAKPPTRPRSYHLHVCQSGSHHELRHLALRDFLRAHDSEAAEYVALKRRLVAQAPADRLAYMAGKASYLDALEARAIVWATVTIVRRAFDSFNDRDLAGAVAAFERDAEWVPYLAALEEEIYRGRDDIERMWREVLKDVPDFQIEFVRLVADSPDLVVIEVVFGGLGKASGAEIRTTVYQAVSFRNGKVTRVQGFRTAAEALEAVGLRE